MGARRRFTSRHIAGMWSILVASIVVAAASRASFAAAPPAPTNLTVADHGTFVSLDWDDVPKVAGYLVYTSATSGGPPTLLNRDRVLVAAGSVWAYDDTGANRMTGWRALGFDDSSWKTGPAQFGYGDGDEATVVSFGPSRNAKYITTYFRKKFTAPDPSLFGSLTIRLLVDDGAVIYVNGTEALRRNMPAGTITSSTTAVVSLSPPEESTFFDFSVAASLLVAGDNVLAVEVHQQGEKSSDLSFDLELRAIGHPVPASSLDDREAPVGANRYYRVSAVSSGGTEGPLSAEACGEAGVPDAPGAPTGSDFADRIDLKWTAPQACDVVAYHVYRAAAPAGAKTRLDKTAVAGTTFSDSSLPGPGTFYYTITAIDTAGNESAASGQAAVLHGDHQPPSLTGLKVDAITASSATVSWKTDEPADSVVEYGPTTAYGSNAFDAKLTLDHSVALSGLYAGVHYDLRASSKDASGNRSSGLLAFETSPGTVLALHVAVSGPADSVRVLLDVTSSLKSLESVGARVTYDPLQVELDPKAIDAGAGLPAGWAFTWKQVSAGEADLVVGDPTAGTAAIADATEPLQVAILTFHRLQAGCGSLPFGFSDRAPAPGPEQEAFPKPRFVTFLDAKGNELTASATGTPTGSAGAGDHAFLRGNVNARSLHRVDIGDVVDLAEILFGGLAPVRCQGAMDVDGSGDIDITDLITLIQGIFHPDEVTIPPPNFTVPGGGVPGTVVPDGGSIPSVLGCEEGEACP